MNDSVKIPTWFYVVCTIALLWNGMGIAAFIMDATMSPEALSALPEAQQQVYNNTPQWAMIAYGVAVFAGFLGCLLMLLKKSLALPLLILSLAAVLVQMYAGFFVTNSFEVFGPGGLIMPIMVIVVAILLILLARSAKAKNWIR